MTRRHNNHIISISSYKTVDETCCGHSLAQLQPWMRKTSFISISGNYVVNCTEPLASSRESAFGK